MQKDASLNTMFNGPIIDVENPINRQIELRLGNRRRIKCLCRGICIKVLKEPNQRHFIINDNGKYLHIGQGTMVTRISST